MSQCQRRTFRKGVRAHDHAGIISDFRLVAIDYVERAHKLYNEDIQSELIASLREAMIMKIVFKLTSLINGQIDWLQIGSQTVPSRMMAICSLSRGVFVFLRRRCSRRGVRSKFVHYREWFRQSRPSKKEEGAEDGDYQSLRHNREQVIIFR